MDNGILVDWAFSLQTTILEEVENRFPDEKHRWPLLRGFNAKGYSFDGKYLIAVLIDDFVQIPNIGVIEEFTKEEDLEAPSIQNIESWHNRVRSKFSLRETDAILIIPVTEGKNVNERFEKFNQSDKTLWTKQINMNIARHYYHLKGFSIYGGFVIPPGFRHLEMECTQFFRDHPNYTKNVFIMMKFDNSNEDLFNLYSEVQSLLRDSGWNPVRADDKMYLKDRDLWNNVCVYMLCCKQGIAILENYSAQEYNPNVAIEYGFMRALDKRVLLLADKDFPKERADVSGKERLYFNMRDMHSIDKPVTKWLNEIG